MNTWCCTVTLMFGPRCKITRSTLHFSSTIYFHHIVTCTTITLHSHTWCHKFLTMNNLNIFGFKCFIWTQSIEMLYHAFVTKQIYLIVLVLDVIETPFHINSANSKTAQRMETLLSNTFWTQFKLNNIYNEHSGVWQWYLTCWLQQLYTSPSRSCTKCQHVCTYVHGVASSLHTLATCWYPNQRFSISATVQLQLVIMKAWH